MPAGLFTIGFLHLTFWKGVLAILLSSYYLGVYFSALARYTCLLAGWKMSTGEALKDFILALVCVPSMEHIVRDPVRVQSLLPEGFQFATWRWAGQNIHVLNSAAGLDGARLSDEIDLAAHLAHDAHVDRHGWRLWHEYSRRIP